MGGYGTVTVESSRSPTATTDHVLIDVAVLLTAQPPYEVLQLAYDHREETSMGIFDKAKDKVEQLIG
ncbi:MAG: hypothetical protein ACRDTD_12295, partial [Pseudonocardiaceae bacterium]